MERNTILKHKKQGYLVIFKCMVNDKEFRTNDDFQFRLDEFEIYKIEKN